MLYQKWHYDRYQSNIDYNQSLRKQGGYLDTCMNIAQRAILRHVSDPNDFRILSYSYDLALSTIPRDTTQRFYDFTVVYSKRTGSELATRVAKYLINFKQDFQILYDVDIKDNRAKEVVTEHRKDLNKLKTLLQNVKDSGNKSAAELKDHLETSK